MKFKYTMIGAGSANLFGTLYMVDNGINPEDILIIEQGNSPYNLDTNNYTDQIGGGGCMSDAKYIYSEHITEFFDYVPKEQSLEWYDWIQKQTKRFHPNPNEITITEPVEIPGILNYKSGWSKAAIKQSTTWHIGTANGKIVIRNIYDYLIKKGVKILTNTIVEDINKDEKYILIKDTKNKIEYEKCLIGVGRNGKGFIDNLANKWGIKPVVNEVHIGVRFECNYSPRMQEVTGCQYDFKLVKDYKDISFRTFCVNSKTAEVVQEQVSQFGKNIKTFNGHAYGLQDGLEKYITNTTNFGIIASVKRQGDGNEYLKSIFDKLDLQTYSYNTIELDFEPTSSANIEFGTFNELEQIFDAYYVECLHDFINDIKEQLAITSYKIYIPEVKNTIGDFGNKDHSINEADGVYIVGDSGISKTRGIVPAAISSLSVCKTFVNK